MEIPASGVKSQSSSGHDVGHTAKEPQLHVSAMNGKVSTLEFTPTQVGAYEVTCTVVEHKEVGMVAKLIVKAS
jgi:plastocyanin